MARPNKENLSYFLFFTSGAGYLIGESFYAVVAGLVTGLGIFIVLDIFGNKGK